MDKDTVLEFNEEIKLIEKSVHEFLEDLRNVNEYPSVWVVFNSYKKAIEVIEVNVNSFCEIKFPSSLAFFFVERSLVSMQESVGFYNEKKNKSPLFQKYLEKCGLEQVPNSFEGLVNLVFNRSVNSDYLSIVKNLTSLVEKCRETHDSDLFQAISAYKQDIERNVIQRDDKGRDIMSCFKEGFNKFFSVPSKPYDKLKKLIAQDKESISEEFLSQCEGVIGLHEDMLSAQELFQNFLKESNGKNYGR